jgi:Major Facilitator Superfamily
LFAPLTALESLSQQVSFMKPRVGVYLSEGMAARLAEAAKIPRATKSALVEAALDRFLGSDDIGDTASVTHHLAGLSRQLEELDRNLRIANETAALHARFHLAVTPLMPVGEQAAACVLGAERFEEFATQVGRRVDLGVSLIRETADRASATRTAPLTPAEGLSSGTGSTVYDPDVGASSAADDTSVPIAVVREDAATLGLQAVEAALFPGSATCRRIEEGEGAVPPRRSVPTWLTAPRQVAKDPVENRSLILRVFLPFVFGYYMAFLFRTINAVMAAPLATELGLGADDLGLLTSVYFVTFAAAQIPIGILLDRFGPRRVLGRGGRLYIVRGVGPFSDASRRSGVDRSGCCLRYDRGFEGARSLVSRGSRTAPERLDGDAGRAGCGDGDIAGRLVAQLDRLA